MLSLLYRIKLQEAERDGGNRQQPQSGESPPPPHENEPSGVGIVFSFPPDGSVKPFSRLAYPRLWGENRQNKEKMMKQSEREPVGRAPRRAASGEVPAGAASRLEDEAEQVNTGAQELCSS